MADKETKPKPQLADLLGMPEGCKLPIPLLHGHSLAMSSSCKPDASVVSREEYDSLVKRVERLERLLGEKE